MLTLEALKTRIALGIRPESAAKLPPFNLDEAHDAKRALDIAEREVKAAEMVLAGLRKESASTNDPMWVGSRLRLCIARTVAAQAAAWLKAVGGR